MNRKEFIKNMVAAAGIAAFGLGCSKEAEASGTTDTNKVAVSAGKMAVVYFSWSPDGNTRFAAETIAKKAGAALFEIKAETHYNSDFNKCCDEAKPECYGKKLRPIKPIEGLDLAKYDVVFVIFQTHGGGGMERVGKEFAEVVGDAAKILPPKAFPGASVKSATKALEAFVTDRLAVK